MGFQQRTTGGSSLDGDRHTLDSRGSSKPLHYGLGGWMLVSAEAWLVQLVPDHQPGALAGGSCRCGGELRDFEVKRLPYEFSLGFLFKVYSTSDPSGCPVAGVVEGA